MIHLHRSNTHQKLGGETHTPLGEAEHNRLLRSNVRQSLANSKDIVDNASYDDVYAFHPGGALRIKQKRQPTIKYYRYTDYETAQTLKITCAKTNETQKITFKANETKQISF